MNSEIKDKWVKALRSGEYKQGKKQLKTLNDEYCCLGVLCDIHSKEQNNGKGWNTFFYLDEKTYLPSVVQDWSELYNRNPIVDDVPLAELNDNDVSFHDIANIIEKKL